MPAPLMPPLSRALAPAEWQDIAKRRLRLGVRGDGKVQVTDPESGRVGVGYSAAQALHDLDRARA